MGTIMNRQLPGMLLTAFAFCITISCSDKSASDPTGLALNDSTAAESRVATASVTLAQSTLEVGQTTQATALLLDRYNNPLSLPVVWSTSDSSLATVSGSGLVTARSPGPVSIIATRASKSGAATLTVVPSTVSVATVTVNLATSSLTVGQTERATATLRDSSNNVVTGPAVVWTSSNASAAALTDSGMVTALAAGSTTISASTGGKTGSAPLAVTATSLVPVASVTVSPASATLQIGASVQLQVSAFDASNNVLTGRVVTSSSANPAIASVNSLGLVTGVSAGTTQITVTCEGITAVATITVSASAPATSPGTVTDLQASVTGSSSVTLSFTQVNDGTGQPAKYDVRYAVSPISWGSATTTTNGTCTTPVTGTATGSKISCTVLGLAPATNYDFQLIAFRGTLNLDAVFGSLSNIVSATTTASATSPVPVASVTVSPASATLQIGATVQLQVTAFDANNNVLTGRVVTSSSANPAIASVNSLGLVTAVSTGVTQITVTSEGKSAIATITVSTAAPVPVATVSVSPSSSSLLVGATVQLSATTRDANNNVLTGRVVTWSSLNSGIASVSSNGLVSAIGAGTIQITATSEGITGSASVTVTVPLPPPPSGSSNEPAGMTLIDQRPFNSLAEHAAPYSPAWDTDTSLSIVQDATAPISPNNVIRVTYPAGYHSGSAPGHAGVPFTTPVKTLYIRFAAKLSLNWQGEDSGFCKYFYAWINGSGDFFFASNGIGSSPLQPYSMLQAVTVFPQGNGNWGPNLVPSARIIRGQWQTYEFILVGNTAGTADGSVDAYLDGVHTTHVGGIQWTSGDGKWDTFEFRPIWGGTGSTLVQQTQTMDWDHVYLSGKN
jgi:uncharacterized protein YjdB